jgi:replicative DNA helicase
MDDNTIDESITFENLIVDTFENRLAEKKVLSYILRKNWMTVYSLNKELFNNEPYKEIFEFVKKNECLTDKQILLKYLVDKNSIEKQESYKAIVKHLYDLDIELLNEKNVLNLTEDLKKLSASRNMLNWMHSTLKNVESFDLEKEKTNLLKFSLEQDSESNIDFGSYLIDFEERLAVLKKMKENPTEMLGIMTGINELDLIMGGLRRKEIGIIIGGTGSGKSISLFNFGSAAFLNDYNVLIVEMEMDKQKSMFRLDSSMSEVAYRKFRFAEIDIEDEEKLTENISKLRKLRKNNLDVLVLPKSSNCFDIEREGRKIARLRGIEGWDLIVIDYLNLMSPVNSESFENSKNAFSQGQISWDIKMLSNRMNCAVWTGNQLTTDGMTESENRGKITLGHLKYSREIAENVDFIFALVRFEENMMDHAELYTLKARDAEKPSKPIRLRPAFDIMKVHVSEGRELLVKKEKKKIEADLF